jgi:hypothetical protein
VQQLTRQLVDLPHEQLPPTPTPVPPAELEPLLGCYKLQGGVDATLQVQWLAGEDATKSVALNINVSGTDGHGSASLVPVGWGLRSLAHLGASEGTLSTLGAAPFALALRGNDTVVVRPKSVSSARVAEASTPLQRADLSYGRREIFFSMPAVATGRGRLAEVAALHVNGWDLYANRSTCASA